MASSPVPESVAGWSLVMTSLLPLAVLTFLFLVYKFRVRVRIPNNLSMYFYRNPMFVQIFRFTEYRRYGEVNIDNKNLSNKTKLFRMTPYFIHKIFS